MEQEVRSNLHIPVLLNESIELLNVRKDGIYIDCTGGRGGHSELILKKLEGTGTLFCLDIDKEAIEFLEKKFKGVKNIKIIKGNFKDIKDILAKFKITGVDGIFADLGVSSPMLDNYDRGFSYHADSFLDMRMDREQKKNAYEVINSYSLNQLVNIFKKYGDIKNPFFVVKEILKKREEKEINTTAELVKIIKDSVSWKERKKEKHPAKTYFQALRIEVNDEIKNLEKLLTQIPNILLKNGTLVILTFHSLEERMVKSFVGEWVVDKTPKELPLMKKPDFSLINRKAILGKKEEEENKRSSSAKLWGVVKNV